MSSWVIQGLLLKPFPENSRVGAWLSFIDHSYGYKTLLIFLILQWVCLLILSIFAAEMSNDISNKNLERVASNRICRSTEIEDLQGPRDPAMAPLSIKVCLLFNFLIAACICSQELIFWIYLFFWQDPRDYFDSQQANALKALGDTGSGTISLRFSVSAGEAYDSLRNAILDIKDMGLSEPIMNQEVALKVINLHMCLSIFEFLVIRFKQEVIIIIFWLRKIN